MFVHTPRRSRREKNVDFGFRNIVDLNSCWKSTNLEDDVCCFSLICFSSEEGVLWVIFLSLQSLNTSHHITATSEGTHVKHPTGIHCNVDKREKKIILFV